MSDPALSKGLVEREVVRIVTPGTVIDPAMLAAKRNNFLAAAVLGRGAAGIAYIDITTGEFATTQVLAADPEAALQEELVRIGPSELLVESAGSEQFLQQVRRSRRLASAEQASWTQRISTRILQQRWQPKKMLACLGG